MLHLTPLSCLPHNCLLLTLDSLNILINASTPDGRPPTGLPSDLDLILLSHSTPTHINALSRIILTHPHTQIYATVPIATLGCLSTLEITPPGPTVTDGVKSEDEYEYLTRKDVEKAFDRITTLRYSQPVILSHGVTITAYPAGHSIGGTVWNIKKDQENIVVMIDWNHAKERIVGGMLDNKTMRLLERASCVITDVRGASIPQVPTRRTREQFFIDSITAAIAAEQSVVIPALPPTRVLDLLLLLDNAFTTTPALQNIPVFYLAHTSQKAVSATRTMLEWLSQDITVQDHPLDFKHVKMVTEYSDLGKGKTGPRLVVVDGLDLQVGSFAQQTFLDIKSMGHLLLFTSRSVSPNSTAAELLGHWETSSPLISDDTPRPIVNVTTDVEMVMEQRTPLQGEELIQWKRADRQTREQKDADLFFEERQRNLLEGNESDSDEDEEEDHLILDTSVPSLRARGSAVLLQDGSNDFWMGDIIGGRASLKHFPFMDKRKRFDEWGMLFKPEEFTRIEDEPIVTRDTSLPSAQVGKKRKWGEVEVETENLPSRVSKSVVRIDVNVRVGYVDLEGLHDGRAAGTLLPRLNPRKLVLVNSTHADIEAFKAMWDGIPRVSREVFAPGLNETFDVSVDTRQYEISVSKDIAKSIKWQTVQNQQIAHVIGCVTQETQSEVDGLPQPDSQALSKPASTLSLLSTKTRSIPPARPLHVGEVRLLELKQRLQKEGYSAVLGEGVLVCDGVVRVLKEEGGSGVRIEGVIGGDASLKAYWEVRKAVYDGLAIL